MSASPSQRCIAERYRIWQKTGTGHGSVEIKDWSSDIRNKENEAAGYRDALAQVLDLDDAPASAEPEKS